MKNSVTPWLSVWTAPRRTIRNILESAKPERNALLLSLIAGIYFSLNRASMNSAGDQMPMNQMILLVLVSGIIGGLLLLYLGSAILRLTGSWLGGKGNTSDLRVALARGIFMPTVLLSLFWIPSLLLIGKENFTYETPSMDSNSLILVLYLICVFLEGVFGIWAMVVGLKAIGEAHGFSAWKALVCCILPFLILLVLIFAIALFF